MEAAKGFTDVAVFLPSLGGGGAERMGVNLVNYFSAHGLQTDLVLCDFSGPWVSRLSPAVRVINLSTKRVAASLPALAGYLRRTRPRALLSMLDRANVVALAARWISGAKTRIAISQRSNLSASVRNYRTLRSRILYALVPYLYSRADAIIGISEGVARNIVSEFAISSEKVTAIYNPVLENPVTAADIAHSTHSWLDAKTVPVILTVGRLTAAKDHPTLLRAFAKLRQQQPARLIILGEGETRLAVERLAEELHLENDLLMPGFIHDPLPWIGKADVFALSSAWEGFGNVLVEAMACGTPVVSTDCPSGPAEILGDGRWGRLVPVGDPEELCSAMLVALRAGERNTAVERAQQFTVEHAAKRYLEVLKVTAHQGC